MVRQPIGLMTHWSENPLVRRPIGPKTHWFENPLVQRPIGPKKGVIGPKTIGPKKCHWSENPLVRKSVIGPKIAGTKSRWISYCEWLIC